MADDQVAAELAEVRELQRQAAAEIDPEPLAPDCVEDLVTVYAPRLLAALDAVLAPHQPRTVVLFGRSCITHRPLKPVPGCVLCAQDEHRQVCPECRDEFGDPVPFADCRARKTALAVLTGEAAGG